MARSVWEIPFLGSRHTDEKWKTAYQLFERVMELPAGERIAFAVSAASDSEVLRLVLELLDAEREEGAKQLSPPTAYGRFAIGELLGRGGMGEVYSAHDTELNRTVAIKFLAQEYFGGPGPVDRIIKEARAASALNHPGIITVYEVMRSEDAVAIVMEHVDGTSLRHLCGKPNSTAEVAKWGGFIAEALAAAHSAGIVHRDVKPENLMIRRDGYIKVLDFGAAAQLGTEDPAGLPIGTLGYMSPEQIQGKPLTGGTDVFSLGVVLMELATGYHPFRQTTAALTSAAIQTAEPRFKTDLPSTVDGALRPLLESMLAKEPDRRPTASSVAAQLATIAHGPTTISWTRRQVATTAAVTLAGTGGLYSTYWLTKANARDHGADFRITPLTTLEGVERQPCISMDGTRVAFAYTAPGEQRPHIYVKGLKDSNPLKITSGESADFRPVFAPSGSRLAFLRAAGGRIRVIIATASGDGKETQIAEIGDVLREFPLLAWEANEDNLLVCDRPNDNQPEVAVFRISVATGKRRQITFPPDGLSDWMPQVSPDGRTLAFARVLETGRGDLWSLPIGSSEESGRPRRLTNTSDVIVAWAWGEESEELLLACRRSNRYQLWRLHVDSNAENLVQLKESVRELSVAVKPQKLVYSAGGTHNYNIWWYPLPPSNGTVRPVIASAAFDGDPRFSPDGKWIAFASERSGQPNIWICARDGSEPRQISAIGAGGFWAGSPSWSPDGKRIAFDARTPETESSIFVVAVDGGPVVRLTGPGPSDIIPVWSRDSRWIYFASNRDRSGMQLWKVPSNGGTPVQVTRNGGLEGFESPDGRFLYYTKRGRATGFWRMPLNGGPEARVPGLESLATRYWEDGAKGIYFVDRATIPVLGFFDFATGKMAKIRELAIPPSVLYRGLSISPDGQGLLYMQADSKRSNLMLVENFS